MDSVPPKPPASRTRLPCLAQRPRALEAPRSGSPTCSFGLHRALGFKHFRPFRYRALDYFLAVGPILPAHTSIRKESLGSVRLFGPGYALATAPRASSGPGLRLLTRHTLAQSLRPDFASSQSRNLNRACASQNIGNTLTFSTEIHMLLFR